MQAILDSLPHNETPFELVKVPVPNTNPPQFNIMVVSPDNKKPVDEATGVDFNNLNYMHQFLRAAPGDAVPPPPSVPAPPQRAEMIKAAKEAGNVRRGPP